MDATFVIYTGVPTPTIPIERNQNLQTILQNIDTAINDHNTAPDYSGYNLYCVTQTDGISHPTNTQNFAEGISKILCNFITDTNDFINTQYPSDQNVLTVAITNLQEPGLIYAPFSIVNTDTIGQVYTKMFAGFTSILNAQDPSSADWSLLSISPDPTTIVDAFNEIIAQLVTVLGDLSGKEDTLPTFDNSANCLLGTSTDTIVETIDLIIPYLCDLPKFYVGSISFGGVTPGTELQDTVQYIIDSVNYLLTNGVITGGTGLTYSAVGGPYQGYELAIDTTWDGLYKAKVTSADDTGDYLNNKITAGSGIQINVLNPGSVEELEIVNDAPADGKVLVNDTDTTSDYLVNKIPYSENLDWGIANIPEVLNEKLNITPYIKPDVFISTMLAYISSSPALFSQFTNLVNQIEPGSCTAPSNLTVVPNVSDFDLTWTASGTADSQNVKYREKNTATWLLTPNVDPANPQTAIATTATVTGLNLNTVYEFIVDSVCTGGGTASTDIYEMIIYSCQTLYDSVASGVISVYQNPLLTVDTIEYRLVNSLSVVVQSDSTTGANPQLSFTSVAAGDYTVEWRYGATVNGVTLWSDDASQLNAWCVSGTINVS